ncbi:MAG: hypothetical protein WCD79_01675 [Chthoniobacteraceae bacterium]
MSILYIHGVNTRDPDSFLPVKELLREYIAPAISINPGTTEIIHGFWGDLATHPAPLSDPAGLDDWASTMKNPVATISAALALYEKAPGLDINTQTSELADMGIENGDSQPFLSEIAPIELAKLLALAVRRRGEYPSILTEAFFRKLVTSPDFLTSLASCNSFKEELAFLNRRLDSVGDSELSDMGPKSKAVAEVFGLVRDKMRSPQIKLIEHALRRWRAALHNLTTAFIGDVFHYLNTRGSPTALGEILTRIVAQIQAGSKRSRELNEPFVLLTHSMGGQIAFDLLSSVVPLLPDKPKVDFWCASASQIGYFAEMRLFLCQKDNDKFPLSVLSKSSCGRLWNVWDPYDILSYTASKVVGGIYESCFRSEMASPLAAHAAYLEQKSFYQALAVNIEKFRRNEF